MAAGLAAHASPEQLLHALSNRRQQLIILPTEGCNLRCHYCYETFSRGKVSDGLVEALSQFIVRRASELDLLELSWFGGEPLIASDVVLRISTLAQSIMGAGHLGEVTTNGTLLKADLLHQLTAVGVRSYQISLDGPPDVHDTTRVTEKGRGSFERILENLRSAADTKLDFHIAVRLHLTSQSVSQIDAFADLVSELVSTLDARFSFFPKVIEDFGHHQTDGSVPDDHDLARAASEVLNSVIPAGRHLRDSPFGGGLDICYAAKPNSLIVRSDGRLAKCTVALEDEYNLVGRLNEDGTISVDQGRLGNWTQTLFTGNSETLSCPMPAVSSQWSGGTSVTLVGPTSS